MGKDNGYTENLREWFKAIYEIIFGDRNLKNITNTMTALYNFNALSNLSFAFRHYWAPIQYEDQFYSLEYDGTLLPNDYSENENLNFNVWNIDLTYNWQFAPGSNIIALYRNSISQENQLSDLPFLTNIDNLLKQGMNHMVSLRLIYFLDYNSLKK